MVRPSRKAFPKFRRAILADSRKETEEFFHHILVNDHSILELLDANYTFLNQRLAMLYNIPKVWGRHFRKVELKDKRRGGLLTQASIHMITSYPTRTSIVIRGKYILENFFGYSPPSPPPDMPNLSDKQNTKNKTLRERIQLHAGNKKCASCHARFDPMGYALENYDAIGRWRNKEKGKPLNTGRHSYNRCHNARRSFLNRS